jgi:ribonuclease BN (tRNA processing enzyme)
LTYKDINAVYISHLHGDHSQGIEYLAFCTYFDPTLKEKIQLFGNGDLLRRGWEDSWKGGLESIQGKLLSLDSYFDVNMIRPNGTFIWEGIEFTIVQSIHIYNGYQIVPCYGLMAWFPTIKKRIYFTADSQHAPAQIMDFYKQADLIIHDCETTPFKSGVHANYQDLCSLPEDIKSKMILVHYADNVLDKSNIVSLEWKEKVEDNGFSWMPGKGDTMDIEGYFETHAEKIKNDKKI